MRHIERHPTPEPGCFGCRAAGVGYQGLQSRQGADPVQKVPVVADDGPRAGKPVGLHDVHWDGRQDSTVFAPAVNVETKTREF